MSLQRFDTCPASRFPAKGFSNGWLFMKETTHRRIFNLVKKMLAIGARSMALTHGAYKDTHEGSIIQELGFMFNLSGSYTSFDHHIIIYRISKAFIFIKSLSNEFDNRDCCCAETFYI